MSRRTLWPVNIPTLCLIDEPVTTRTNYLVGTSYKVPRRYLYSSCSKGHGHGLRSERTLVPRTESLSFFLSFSLTFSLLTHKHNYDYEGAGTEKWMIGDLGELGRLTLGRGFGIGGLQLEFALCKSQSQCRIGIFCIFLHFNVWKKDISPSHTHHDYESPTSITRPFHHHTTRKTNHVIRNDKSETTRMQNAECKKCQSSQILQQSNQKG